MYGYIYETTCKITGKKYIGMHKWSKPELDKSYLGSGIHIKNAINKYGKENFTCRILETCDTREQLILAEMKHISETKAPIRDDYYNIEDGGIGGHSEYYVQPITDNQLKALEKGRHLPASNLLKQTLSNYRKSVIVSNDTRQKLSENQLGRRCINDGVNCKYVKPDELDTYLENGWTLGHGKDKSKSSIDKFKQTHTSKTKEELDEWKLKLSNSFKGRRWITNGTKSIQIQPDKLDEYLSNGWKLGRITKKFND